MGRCINYVAALALLIPLATKVSGKREGMAELSDRKFEQVSFSTWDLLTWDLLTDFALNRSTATDVSFERAFADAFVMRDVRRSFKATSMQREVHGYATRRNKYERRRMATSMQRGPQPSAKVKKVAYMFMMKDSVDQDELWQTFFKGATRGTHSIYFHQYSANTQVAAATRKHWSRFGVHYIPGVKTGWGQLAGVEFALLWEALRDPANAQFVFLSEGHVPLKSASYVYDYLMRESEQSKICLNKHERSLRILSYHEPTRTCAYRDCLQAQVLPAVVGGVATEISGRVLKHHQWVVLARGHAVDVIDNAEDSLRQHLRAVTRSKLPPHGDPAMLGAADESFVATALLLASEKRGFAQANSVEELRDAGVMSECTTFVYWRHCWADTKLGAEYGWNSSLPSELGTVGKSFLDTPKSLWYDTKKSPLKATNDSPRDFGLTSSQPNSEYLANLVDAGFLFARKFGKDEFGQLSGNYAAVLPPLWAAFSARMAPLTPEKFAKESRAWPVLDIGDHQVQTTVLEAEGRSILKPMSWWKVVKGAANPFNSNFFWPFKE